MNIARRSFSATDQMRFAAASGDHNPMHTDVLQARRTQAGAPVVHGINLLLWALNSLAEAQPHLPPLRSLRASFNKFIYLDQYVDIALAQRGPTGARLDLSVDGGSRSKITLAFGDAVEDCPAWADSSLEVVPPSPVPLNLSFEEIPGRSGRILFQMSPEDAMAHFPAATNWLGAQRTAALAASTYLVGMVCPGLHSIYSELSVRSCTESIPQGSLAFRVTEADPRFRSVDMEIAGGGIAGAVHSSARTPPVEQAPMTALAGLVGPAEFAGSIALIVGGSRGLGELTAKLIATGGGRVIVTWKTGKDDAQRVVNEIRSAGGVCEAIGYDAGKPATDQLDMLEEAPTHAYYFATPGIFRPQLVLFAAERFKEFLDIYVNGFWQLSQALRARQPKVSIFYPSSVSVTERPQGMTEYTMAKAAGEVLCADMNTSLAPLHVTVSRLPRLPTDQTASVVPAETALPLDIMLPIIREVQSWPG
jgi:NADP-dependent 3-hydroxy acid dehydrogenase YdfG